MNLEVQGNVHTLVTLILDRGMSAMLSLNCARKELAAVKLSEQIIGRFLQSI
jgi:hypothetical protein